MSPFPLVQSSSFTDEVRSCRSATRVLDGQYVVGLDGGERGDEVFIGLQFVRDYDRLISGLIKGIEYAAGQFEEKYDPITVSRVGYQAHQQSGVVSREAEPFRVRDHRHLAS